VRVQLLDAAFVERALQQRVLDDAELNALLAAALAQERQADARSCR
jgi:hypothetical protein